MPKVRNKNKVKVKSETTPAVEPGVKASVDIKMADEEKKAENKPQAGRNGKKKFWRPVVLVVLDGWGEWEVRMGNPVFVANLPTIDMLNKYYPKLLLGASGLVVGLPWGVFGNSEVGHQTMGSGQIIYHFLPTITAAIQSGVFFQNKVLLKAISWVKKHNSRLHLIGLLSDSGVHSHIDHLFALLRLAKQNGIKDVFVHAIMDGRDTPPNKGIRYIEELEAMMTKIGVGQIASLCGRYYIMDRNRNWDRIEKAFLVYINGEGVRERDPLAALEKQYKREKKGDEYVEPIVMLDQEEKPIGLIKENDAVICFNFRGDRSRQLARAFVDKNFHYFKKVKVPKNVFFVGFTQYDEDLDMPVAYEPQKITTRVGQILSEHGKKQLRIAETEKFAHVTYFFNGGWETPFPGEERIIIPSKNVRSYAEVPEMSAREVTAKLLAAIESDKYDFILVNYANPDMVGHTGNFQAAVKTLEVTDECLSRLIKAVLKRGGCLLITADHGNIEEMINLETGKIDTQHSTNPVPCWFVTPENKFKKPRQAGPKKMEGMIADIAPTILELFGWRKPGAMIGDSLLPKFRLQEILNE